MACVHIISNEIFIRNEFRFWKISVLTYLSRLQRNRHSNNESSDDTNRDLRGRERNIFSKNTWKDVRRNVFNTKNEKNRVQIMFVV